MFPGNGSRGRNSPGKRGHFPVTCAADVQLKLRFSASTPGLSAYLYLRSVPCLPVLADVYALGLFILADPKSNHGINDLKENQARDK